jgi:hypothetical protein
MPARISSKPQGFDLASRDVAAEHLADGRCETIFTHWLLAPLAFAARRLVAI